MKRAGFIALTVGITLLILSSLSIVRITGILHPVHGGIADSERFSNVLMEENMTAWFNGHLHTPHAAENTRVDKWGTSFIDDGSIDPDKAESLLLKFEDGSKEVEVRSRNHTKREWNTNLKEKFSFKLDYPFDYDGNNLKVWVFSDIQPSSDTAWQNFENTIEDANEFIDADIALIPGDLVHFGTSEEFENFLNHLEKSTLPLENFYSLAGNHEWSPYFTGDHSEYEEYLVSTLGTKDKKKYSLEVGNVSFLFMSDAKAGGGGEIDENTFKWWEDIVKNQQNNINHITLTHHPLNDTVKGSTASISRAQSIKGVDMFKIGLLLALISFTIAYETSS